MQRIGSFTQLEGKEGLVVRLRSPTASPGNSGHAGTMFARLAPMASKLNVPVDIGAVRTKLTALPNTDWMWEWKVNEATINGLTGLTSDEMWFWGAEDSELHDKKADLLSDWSRGRAVPLEAELDADSMWEWPSTAMA